MLCSLAVGSLQMFHVRAGLLTNYGADLLGTAWIYAMIRLGWTVFQRRRTMKAATAGAVTFVLCTASEVGQYLGVVPGRYDPYDIVTFALAVAGSLALERVFGPFVEPAPTSDA